MEHMSRVSTYFHRRSLTLACVALCLSLFAASQVIEFAVWLSKSPDSLSLYSLVWTVSWCVGAFGVCIHAMWNLILEVERGYSPGRCQAAAVVLFFALVVCG